MISESVVFRGRVNGQLGVDWLTEAKTVSEEEGAGQGVWVLTAVEVPEAIVPLVPGCISGGVQHPDPSRAPLNWPSLQT